MQKLLISVLLFLIIFPQIASSQKRILVNQSGDVVPITKENSGLAIIKQSTGYAASQNCGQAVFGYSPDKYPVAGGGQYALHKDIMAEWFEAPASGRIDSIYWIMGGVCAQDSTLVLRIFHSNIHSHHGPGYDGYPDPSLSTCWGYYINTTDAESQVGAFPEDATDTAWQSTVTSGPGPSYPPMGEGIWGLTGVPVHHVHENQINGYDLTSVTDLVVAQGDPFFVTLRVNGYKGDPCTGGGPNTVFRRTLEPDPKQTHDWKFYENVAIFPGAVCKGWVARGEWNLSIWYVMTPSSNVPPNILAEQLQNTISPSVRYFTASITDCDASDSTHAGVESAFVRYSVDGGPQLISPMLYINADQWEANIPGQPKGSTVSYRVIAEDSSGLADSTKLVTYKVVDLNSESYRADTAFACTPAAIHSATAISASEWFVDSARTGTGSHRGDDGTAGPFSLGGPFVYFGDTVNYAWVGVNGALALSKNATDTIDVNLQGFATASWDFPFRQHHSRADTTSEGGEPRNFIAPYWADWITVQDSPMATFGKIRHSISGDKFIVEYDSVGVFDPTGAVGDIDVFRVVLNRTTGVIEFQYDNIGSVGQETTPGTLIGIQCDSLTHHVATGDFPPFNLFNNGGYPAETRLYDGLCIKYTPTAYHYTATEGWDLVSVSSIPPSYAKAYLFPTAISNAFKYFGSYVPVDPLENGAGYWMKFGEATLVTGPGLPLNCIDVSINKNWNMIGALGTPIATPAITTTPPGLVDLATYFEFNGGYSLVSTLVPGHGYWVSSSDNGTLHMCTTSTSTVTEKAGQELEGFTRLSFQNKNGKQALFIGSDASGVKASRYALPPAGPSGFDARFTSGRMVETYPAILEKGTHYDYTIALTGELPVVVKWSGGKDNGTSALVLKSQPEGKILAVLTGSGTVTLTEKEVTNKGLVSVSLVESMGIPHEFALGQNYPNPFNPVTRFQVDVPYQSTVEVSIYDVLGRKIATLMQGVQDAGYHTMEWNGHDGQGLQVPTGMYFMRMTATVAGSGNEKDEQPFSSVRKIMLMK